MRLLQSFLTHIVEEYVLNLQSKDGDVPGMAWCSRITEQLHPEWIIPETKTFASRFNEEQHLHSRIDTVGQLVTIARDLDLTDAELLEAAITVEKVSSQPTLDEDEPPASAEDIPLSRVGSLILYTARQVSNTLYRTTEFKINSPFAIFPDHQELIKQSLSSPEQGTGMLGTEPEALIDAVFALGLITLERDRLSANPHLTSNSNNTSKSPLYFLQIARLET